MAEKEERILIKKEINHHPPYGGWRGDGKEIVLTRQEAIKKISSHVLMCDISTMDTDEIAEAALNALLEETK